MPRKRLRGAGRLVRCRRRKRQNIKMTSTVVWGRFPAPHVRFLPVHGLCAGGVVRCYWISPAPRVKGDEWCSVPHFPAPGCECGLEAAGVFRFPFCGLGFFVGNWFCCSVSRTRRQPSPFCSSVPSRSHFWGGDRCELVRTEATPVLFLGAV